MTDTQLPKALQLAAMFDHPLPPDWEEMQAAAAELRRLHAELEQARAALSAQGEPVGEVFTMEALGTPGKPFCHVLLNRTLPTGTKLYTAPPAQAKPMTDEQVCVLRFLLGEVGIDGCYFGDIHPDKRGRFWWRKNLRDAFGITDKGGA